MKHKLLIALDITQFTLNICPAKITNKFRRKLQDEINETKT